MRLLAEWRADLDSSREELGWSSLGHHPPGWNVNSRASQGEPPYLQSAEGLGCPNQQSVDLPPLCCPVLANVIAPTAVILSDSETEKADMRPSVTFLFAFLKKWQCVCTFVMASGCIIFL